MTEQIASPRGKFVTAIKSLPLHEEKLPLGEAKLLSIQEKCLSEMKKWLTERHIL
jgi:hypothetical protein